MHSMIIISSILAFVALSGAKLSSYRTYVLQRQAAGSLAEFDLYNDNGEDQDDDDHESYDYNYDISPSHKVTSMTRFGQNLPALLPSKQNARGGQDGIQDYADEAWKPYFEPAKRSLRNARHPGLNLVIEAVHDGIKVNKGAGKPKLLLNQLRPRSILNSNAQSIPASAIFETLSVTNPTTSPSRGGTVKDSAASLSGPSTKATRGDSSQSPDSLEKESLKSGSVGMTTRLSRMFDEFLEQKASGPGTMKSAGSRSKKLSGPQVNKIAEIPAKKRPRFSKVAQSFRRVTGTASKAAKGAFGKLASCVGCRHVGTKSSQGKASFADSASSTPRIKMAASD